MIKHLCLLSALAIMISSLLAIPPGMAGEICGQYDVLPVMDGRYIIQNNVWGASTAQCVAVPDANATDFIIASSRHNQISVASYPSIFRGCHWGRCSANSSMPLRVIQIKSAPFSWSFSNRSSGIWNAAAEAWFSPIPDSSHGYYGGAELMIWLDRQILQPAGEKVGRVFIGGAWWDVWQAKMGWNYIAYEREVPTDSIQLDLMDFINDSLSRGYINRSWYLHNLQAGFEIQAGGEGLTSHSFSVLINGGEENGTEAFTSPPPFKCMKRFRAIKQARIGQHICKERTSCLTLGPWHIYLFSRLPFFSSISQKKWLSAEVRGERTMGYFIVKKEFTNQDDDKKTKYQPSEVKIDDSSIPDRRLEKWEKLGWIEWHR